MIIIQNPGDLKEGDQEKEDLKKCDNNEQFIKICREAFQGWIEKKQNKNFWSEVIKNVQKIDPNIKIENILEYFYITDVIKKRGKDTEVQPFEKEILKREVETVIPKLILVCGSRAWNSIKDIFETGIIKINNEKDGGIGTVQKEHGFLFKLKNQEMYIIPLLHFSARVRMNSPRNSYYDYMNEGFEEFMKLK